MKFPTIQPSTAFTLLKFAIQYCLYLTGGFAGMYLFSSHFIFGSTVGLILMIFLLPCYFHIQTMVEERKKLHKPDYLDKVAALSLKYETDNNIVVQCSITTFDLTYGNPCRYIFDGSAGMTMLPPKNKS